MLWRCWLARKNLSDEVLAWLSVWSEVQMICIWSGWCHCHPIISASENPEWFILLVPAYPGSPGKKAVKRLCVCVWMMNKEDTVGHGDVTWSMLYALVDYRQHGAVKFPIVSNHLPTDRQICMANHCIQFFLTIIIKINLMLCLTFDSIALHFSYPYCNLYCHLCNVYCTLYCMLYIYFSFS